MACEVGAALVEGVDYEVDLLNGRIMFLSTSPTLGPTVAEFEAGGGCGVQVDWVCGGPECAYLETYGCDGAAYVHDGYATVMQTGAEDFKSDDEKINKMIGLEAEPLASATPLDLEMDVGFGAHQACLTWKAARELPFECQTAKTPAQHLADRTRPDSTFYFPVWRRGRYLAARFRIDGIGGGGKFSQLDRQIQHWGQQDSP